MSQEETGEVVVDEMSREVDSKDDVTHIENISERTAAWWTNKGDNNI